MTVFGNRAFKRLSAGTEGNPNAVWENRINKALFDVVMVGFTQYEQRDIVPRADAVREALYNIMTTNREFMDTITLGTNQQIRVRARFAVWSNELQSVVGSSPRILASFLRHSKGNFMTRIPHVQSVVRELRSLRIV
jgi:hypothetical protein